MAPPRPDDVRAVLARHGVAGANLEALASAPEITAAAIASEYADITRDANVRNVPAVLVRRLALRFNVPISSPRRLDPGTRAVVAKIEQRRRLSGGERRS